MTTVWVVHKWNYGENRYEVEAIYKNKDDALALAATAEADYDIEEWKVIP